MTLYINSTEFQKLELALITEGKIITFEQDLAFNENYKTLELLQKFLKKSKVEANQLTQIIVNSGPGSFTGIRVGASIAQAIGFALNIPVKALGKQHVPKDLSKLKNSSFKNSKTLHYGAEPNITKPKKK